MQKKKNAKRADLRKVLSICGYGFVLVFALALGAGYGWLHTSKVIKTIGLSNLLSPPAPQELFQKNDVVVLVLGCDEDRSTGGAKITRDAARSDSMLLVKFDFANKRVYGLSIPRDTLVGFDQYRPKKINAYHAIGGNDLAAKAVEALLPGVQIDRTVSINYEGFRQMVDAVGGVPMNVDKNMNWDDNAGDLHIHLNKGEQILNGQHAEDFVRFRHSDSDFARQDRQHQFIIAFKDKIHSNPFAMTQVLDGVAKMLEDGFSDLEVVGLGKWVEGVPKENIKMGTLPVHDVPGYNLAFNPKDLQTVLTEYDLAPVAPGTSKG